MFILNLTYKKSLDEVNRHLADHNTYLQRYYDNGSFICSGRKEPRTGGIILCTFDSLDSVKQAISEDPFFKYEIAEYEIIEFTPTRSSESFKQIIK